MRKLLVHLLAILLVACSAELSDEESRLATDIGLNLKTAQAVRARGDGFERLTGYDRNYDVVDAPGLILLTKPNRGKDELPTVRNLLKDSGFVAYLNDQSFGYGPDTIAILENAGPYEYLAIVRINGINYDIGHSAVIERYRLWDEKYGLELVGAGFDWMLAEFHHPPENWTEFASEVYEFCPDVVDQGTGSIEVLAQEMEQMNSVYLWWD